MRWHWFLFPWVGGACLLLAACAVDDLSRATRIYAKDQAQALERDIDRFEQSVHRGSLDSTRDVHINKPWVAGSPVPLARELSLPKALRADVKTTLIFKRQASTLLLIANRISEATAIPVRVRPDALLPRSAFLPRLSGEAVTTIESSPEALAMPSGTLPLSDILDRIAAIHEVQWRYTGKSIEFYRTQTRTFNVRALLMSASSTMRLGKGAGQGIQGFDSASQTELSLGKQNVMADVTKQLEPFLTRAGVVAAQPGSLSSVVITDTPVALDAVDRYLVEINRRLTRRVRLVFEQITVTRQQSHEQGIDWQLALATELGQLDMPSGISGAAPSLLSASAAVGVGGISAGLALKAVSRYADVIRHTTVPVMTLNQRPVTHAVRSTFTYIDQVKSVAVSQQHEKASSVLPAVAVSQKRETVGAFLTLVPDVQDDGQVLLSVAFDNTVAMPMKTMTFGSEQSKLQVQQLDLRGNGTVQQIVAYPGRPTLVAGFEHQDNEVNQSRRSPSAPKLFGGHDVVEHQKTMTLIFVTVQVHDGI